MRKHSISMYAKVLRRMAELEDEDLTGLEDQLYDEEEIQEAEIGVMTDEELTELDDEIEEQTDVEDEEFEEVPENKEGGE